MARAPARVRVRRTPRRRPHILADAARIEKVLFNLLFNTAQHGRADAPVVLHVRREERAMVLSVANHGRPIPPQALRTISEPFVRGSDPAEDEQGGRSKTSLGLGLFIVREIVRGHGDQVDVESTAESGTVFTVRLPDSAAPPSGPGNG